MFVQSSKWYDLIYSFKDYPAEAQQVKQLILDRKPQAQEVLDIGCGTGEHHKFLKDSFSLSGLDLNPTFIEIAQEKNPTLTYFEGDMRSFDLSRKYDVILCMFSSIGYVRSLEELVSTFRCFRSHLKEEGLLIVEPWISPEDWYEGRIHMLTHEKEGVKICRMNVSETQGNFSVINFHFLVGTQEEGVQHFEERHELLLISVEEMKEAFRVAGFEVEHDPGGLTGRGLYYAKMN